MDLEDKVSLKNLAEMLGLEYKVVRLGEKTTRAVISKLEKLEELLNPKIEKTQP